MFVKRLERFELHCKALMLCRKQWDSNNSCESSRPNSIIYNRWTDPIGQWVLSRLCTSSIQCNIIIL